MSQLFKKMIIFAPQKTITMSFIFNTNKHKLKNRK